MKQEAGFTLMELLLSMSILLVVSGIVIGGTIDLTRLSTTMTNRSDMHSGVRNATALLQQEVGQAGRISLPGPIPLSAAVGIGVATVTSAPLTACSSASTLSSEPGPAGKQSR